MKEGRVSQLLQALAEEGVPDDVDLWPSVRAGVEEGRASRFQWDGRPAPSSEVTARRRSLALAVGLAALVLAGSLIAAPNVQVSLVEILGLDAVLTRDTVTAVTVTASVSVSATVPASAHTGQPPSDTPQPTPTPFSTAQNLVFEDTPLPGTENSQ